MTLRPTQAPCSEGRSKGNADGEFQANTEHKGDGDSAPRSPHHHHLTLCLCWGRRDVAPRSKPLAVLWFPKYDLGTSSGTPRAFVRSAVSWTGQNQNLWGGAASSRFSRRFWNHRVVFVVGPTWRSPGESYLPSRRASLSSSLAALMQPPPLLPNVGSETSGNKSQNASTQTTLNHRRN